MKKFHTDFAVAGSVMSIIFFMIANFLTSPHTLWFIYPTFVMLLWPIGLYCANNRKFKHLSIFCSGLLITFLIAENLIDSPQYPWSLFAIYPILFWPILTCLGKYAKTLTVALIGSMSIILYYTVLNMILSPQYIWAIYPAFAVLWWPLSVYHMRNKTYFLFSIHASLLTIVFFTTVNAITTPHTIWAVYPIFCVLWWPLIMYYYVYKRSLNKQS